MEKVDVKHIVGGFLVIAKEIGYVDLTALHQKWFIQYFIKPLADKSLKEQTLLAHRGSYKSSLVSLGIALRILLLPNDRIGLFRKDEEAAKGVIDEVYNIILHDYMKRLFYQMYGEPVRVLVKNAASIKINFTTKIAKEPTVKATPIHGSLTGWHYDFVINDDITTMRDHYSTAERDYTKLAYTEISKNVLNRTGHQLNVGTPWHTDDVHVKFKNVSRYTCRQTGLMTESEIQTIKKDVTPVIFSLNYMLEAITPDFFIQLNFRRFHEGGMYSLAHVDKSFGGGATTALTLIGEKNGMIYSRGYIFGDVSKNLGIIKTIVGNLPLHSETNDDKGLLKRIIPHGVKYKTYFEHENKDAKISNYIHKYKDELIMHEDTDLEYIAQVSEYGKHKRKDAPDSLSSGIRLLKTLRSGVRHFLIRKAEKVFQ